MLKTAQSDKIREHKAFCMNEVTILPLLFPNA